MSPCPSSSSTADPQPAGQAARVLFCHCAFTRIIPEDTKQKVLAALEASGTSYESVPDLCALAAEKNPSLKDLAASTPIKIAACFPRAVKWLFHAADAPLPETGTEILNMREQEAEQVIRGLLQTSPQDTQEATEQSTGPQIPAGTPTAGKDPTPEPGSWKPWFPVIDYQRCTNCMQCLTFCLFDVYGVDAQGSIDVQTANHCKTDCPACSRVCPEAAIMFPKYKQGPINGDVVRDEDLARESMKVDISALLGGDIYESLRERSTQARKRFSTERDESKALLERKRCLKKLKKTLDIPDEVLMTLPSVGDIEDRTRRAREKSERRKQRSQSMQDQRPATEEEWGI